MEAVALQNLCHSVNLTQLIKELTPMTETSSTLNDVIMTYGEEWRTEISHQ